MSAGDWPATIAWLGYDTPDDLPGAASEGPADDGANDLIATVEEIDRINPDAYDTVVAHSYGSVVAGHAMADGLPVEAVAVVGSPGWMVRVGIGGSTACAEI